MSEKPIIRHCYNCEWCRQWGVFKECEVKYEFISLPSIEAQFCKHYKQKGKEDKCDTK